ncbi:hypothetical protein H696_04857 [Fonticula alba]|uniref:Non-haem dioxygenase N-terminal domain-containing protein n=1 Tax=Fonticula alba TaxID=691883 RepID=A0A058Z2R2_FONAL|nr:hypothetical protein H696_04857 [Fonticula alba]KCV68564.1 hypothetical protein H696_04857 [Fonticula alba]|eukprot:XP_009496996.1 hypothetical protein H696_04857 [Fonticula alba]
MTEFRTADNVIVVEYADVINPKADLSAQIEAAFGSNPSALGLILVRGIPELENKVGDLLPLASRLGGLSAEEKAKYEFPDLSYMVGWSHGKERFQGVFDTAKGSWYANPSSDTPTDDPAELAKYREFAQPNVWPTEEIPQLEGAFKALGQLIVDTGARLAVHCDKFISSQIADFPANYIENVIKNSKATKGRLLHYFPVDNPPASRADDTGSWCGWHLDHGTLTGLTPARYYRGDEETSMPDATAGLYIRNRNGDVLKAPIPRDCLAFQLGQSLQIASGGHLSATPHCVIGPVGLETAGIARNTLAVFMQPNFSEKLYFPQTGSPEELAKKIDVPQWKAGQDFGEFTIATNELYY